MYIFCIQFVFQKFVSNLYPLIIQIGYKIYFGGDLYPKNDEFDTNWIQIYLYKLDTKPIYANNIQIRYKYVVALYELCI